MPNRPILTAQWRNLLVLNFSVPAEIVARIAPPGTEPDLHNGQSYISIVGFRFENVRFLGLSIPGHTMFPEINLRYYVRRKIGNEIRRGVVFAREIAPHRAIAFVANRLFHENYVTRPMRSLIHIAETEATAGDTVEYAWKSSERRRISLSYGERRGDGSTSKVATNWNRFAARVVAPLASPAPKSLDEFLIEHYWGYTRGRDNRTREYRVEHSPWRVAPVHNVIWECDVRSTYDLPLAEYVASAPTSAFLADGSAVRLFRSQGI